MNTCLLAWSHCTSSKGNLLAVLMSSYGISGSTRRTILILRVYLVQFHSPYAFVMGRLLSILKLTLCEMLLYSLSFLPLFFGWTWASAITCRGECEKALILSFILTLHIRFSNLSFWWFLLKNILESMLTLWVS